RRADSLRHFLMEAATMFVSTLVTLILLLGAFPIVAQGLSVGNRIPTINVGPNVLVSTGDASAWHMEVLIDAHPSDPNKLVACSIADTGRGGVRDQMYSVPYLSNDRGKTWAAGEKFINGGDPVCGYGPDGAAYFSAGVVNTVDASDPRSFQFQFF